MCGICGIHSFDRSEPADALTLGHMLASIEHRGPDAEGVFIGREIALGMRRLSIIDLPGGNQPLYNEAGDVAVVFNGEIYNYQELRQSLRARGHQFATDSDTEVIVHLYEEQGDDCVQSLRGMFAFALWDAKKHRLLVARDRLGIKPLYYTVVDGELVFGSEIKSLLCHPGVTPRLDHAALGLYLSLKYAPAPQTMFAGISSLPPAHILVCDSSGARIRKYWDIPFQDDSTAVADPTEYVDRLEDLLLQTIKLHLQSDVPFGAFLSGGVDSSLIVAMMSRLHSQQVKTFSIGFEGSKDSCDERQYARIVAKKLGTDHHEVEIRPDGFEKFAEQVAWHLDQPLADHATWATYALSEFASEHVKMVLTGEGGDELFAGYARYYGESLYPSFHRIPRWIRSAALGISRRASGLRRMKLALYALSQADESARIASWFPLFNEDMKRELLASATMIPMTRDAAGQLFASHLEQSNSRLSLNRMLYVDTKLWLPDLLLLRGDKMTMAKSIEGRVPLLDHHVVNFAASLPTSLKLNGRKTKYLLKEVGRRYLPREIIDRKKEGFPIPVSDWLRGPCRSFMRDLLSPETIRRRGLFDATHVSRMMSEHEKQRTDHSNQLWGLMSLELWQRVFIDSTRSAHATTPNSRTRELIAAAASATPNGRNSD